MKKHVFPFASFHHDIYYGVQSALLSVFVKYLNPTWNAIISSRQGETRRLNAHRSATRDRRCRQTRRWSVINKKLTEETRESLVALPWGYPSSIPCVSPHEQPSTLVFSCMPLSMQPRGSQPHIRVSTRVSPSSLILDCECGGTLGQVAFLSDFAETLMQQLSTPIVFPTLPPSPRPRTHDYFFFVILPQTLSVGPPRVWPHRLCLKVIFSKWSCRKKRPKRSSSAA